jgi:hypothetical protein
MKNGMTAARLAISSMQARRFIGAALLATLLLRPGIAEAAPEPPTAPTVSQLSGSMQPVTATAAMATTATVACSPRPRVFVHSEQAVLPEMIGLPGRDALGVTVTSSVAGNAVRAIRFTLTSNALVSVLDAEAHAAPYDVAFPSGAEPARLSFALWRPSLALSSFARLVATDACGEWTTFVGRGAGSH